MWGGGGGSPTSLSFFFLYFTAHQHQAQKASNQRPASIYGDFRESADFHDTYKPTKPQAKLLSLVQTDGRTKPELNEF